MAIFFLKSHEPNLWTASDVLAIFENPQIPETVARLLDAGLAVIVFHGRSEFGPRALGQRSILADPRKPWLRSLREIVVEFERLAGIPLILNTSFNHGGRPIVETVEQAVETFGSMAVNAMVLGRFIVVKKLFPGLAAIGALIPRQPIEMTVVQNGQRIVLEPKARSARQIIRQVQELTGAVVFVRHDFPLYGPYLTWLREGRKVTTIRYRKRGVELPTRDVLPLYETRDYGIGKRDRPAASVRVLSIRYQRFGELTEEDARLDGFEALSDMLTAFRQIYPNLGAHDWVTIYGIRLVSDAWPAASR
ncbi:MAG TPA: carbamoyltransferase C-terminal domain-containing protein [Actinomycetes bacterium]|nr:carbamoyltransferase C-terminal domain-containing protein [Actinomycetes bacterium]